MTQLRICCVCNPDAARNRRLLQRLRPRLQGISSHYYFETTKSADFAGMLNARLVEETDLLILSGGDGTMQQGVTALLASGAKRFPMLALLPAGSTNVAATDLGGLSGLEQAVWALESGLQNPHTTSVSPLVITPDGRKDSCAGFFFGVGAAPIAVARYRKLRRPVRGLPVLDAGASVFAIGGTMLEVGLRGGHWKHNLQGEVRISGRATGATASSLLIVTSLNGLFKGITPWWGAHDSPLKYLQLGPGAPSLIRNLPGILRGQPSTQVRASSLYASGGAERVEIPSVGTFTIDGELFKVRGGRSALTVEAGARLEILRYV